MDNTVFESLVFENASGVKTILSDRMVTSYWELRGRSGFSAPDVDIITQKYANGVTKILKRITKPRTVSINMIVTGQNTAMRDTLFFRMIGQLMDVSNGEVGKLYIKRSDGVEVYLNCAYSSGLNVTDEYRKFHRFTLEFYAADPFFYRDVPDVTITLPASSKITLRDGLYLGDGHVLGETSGKGLGTIWNESQETLQPVIKAMRVQGQFAITNQTTGKELILKNIFGATTDILVIDTREYSKSIYLLHADGTKTAAGQYLDWDNIDLEFPIIPGENVISFEAGVGSYTEGVVFELAEKYLSA